MISIVCGCKTCINHDHGKRTCKLKVVFVDEDGTCGDREDGTDVDADADSSSDELIDQ